VRANGSDHSTQNCGNEIIAEKPVTLAALLGNVGRGRALLRAGGQQGLEGIASKLRSSTYRAQRPGSVYAQ